MSATEGPRPERAGDPIGRYLDRMRTYAEALTRKADREAEHNAATGEHQELDALFHLRDDAQDTRERLEWYCKRLLAAKRAGRYVGETTLLRVRPDGSTEPWAPHN